MKLFYFVGGPTEGHMAEFLERLDGVGGTPDGWQVFPHLEPDRRALHLVQAESEDEILAHLAHFDPIYERGEISEVLSGAGRVGRPAGASLPQRPGGDGRSSLIRTETLADRLDRTT